MKNRFFIIALSVIMICSIFTMVSCEHNIYLSGNETWKVRNMYFSSFGDALSWLMNHGETSKSLASSSIPDSQTIYLMSDVSGQESVSIPSSFEGQLCIDFQGFRCEFNPNEEKFFDIQGGDRIEIINGRAIIPEESISGNKTMIVNVSTVSIDNLVIEDRREEPQAVEVSSSGSLVIKSTSSTKSTISGAFAVQEGGKLEIRGGEIRIDSFKNPEAMTGLVIKGGEITNPDRYNAYVEAAITAGGNPANVKTTAVHEVSQIWSVSLESGTHYNTCSGCSEHFNEAAHTFSGWVYDEEPTGDYYIGRRQCTKCGYTEKTAKKATD